MRAGILVAVFAASLTVSVQAGAEDIAAGEKIYQSVCKNCHGPTAKGLASFPKLAGNTPEYLTERLKQYRAGETLGPNTPLMAPLAEPLSDDDITNIVAYITTTFK